MGFSRESQGNYVFSEEWVLVNLLRTKFPLVMRTSPDWSYSPSQPATVQLLCFFSNLQLLKSCTKALKGHHKEGWGIPHLNFHFCKHELCFYLSLKNTQTVLWMVLFSDGPDSRCSLLALMLPFPRIGVSFVVLFQVQERFPGIKTWAEVGANRSCNISNRGSN